MIDTLPTPKVAPAAERAKRCKIVLKTAITRHSLSERGQAVACEISDTLFAKRLDVGRDDQLHLGSIGGLDPRARYELLEHLAREAGLTLALAPESVVGIGGLRAASALMREALAASTTAMDTLDDERLDRAEAEELRQKLAVLGRVVATLQAWCDIALRDGVVHLPSSGATR